MLGGKGNSGSVHLHLIGKDLKVHTQQRRREITTVLVDFKSAIPNKVVVNWLAQIDAMVAGRHGILQASGTVKKHYLFV